VNSDQQDIVASTRATLRETSRLVTELATRQFSLIADEPHNDSPGDGPTPTEYLLMALASCTAQTLRSYTDRKYDYPGDITVEVSYHEPQEEGAARYLQRTISLSEDVPPEHLQSMMEITERTPVTLLLAFAWSVRTEFVNADVR
jgi:putative redox protein